MNFASIFNYSEASVWFMIAFVLFLRHDKVNFKLTRIAIITSSSFFLFGISDLVEASTGAWWRPLWLLGLKGLCVLSFVSCWIKYNQLTKTTKSAGERSASSAIDAPV